MSKVFIGGSRRLSELNSDVTGRIDNIIMNGYPILIGDANGADKSVQKYLREKKYRNVLVYCMGPECRNNLGGWETKNIPANLRGKRDFSYYSMKDREMAREADYGLMIWDGKSKGTLNNILALLLDNKKTLVYFSPKKIFYTVTAFDVLKGLLPHDDKQLQAMFQKALDTQCDAEEQKEKQVALSFH